MHVANQKRQHFENEERKRRGGVDGNAKVLSVNGDCWDWVSIVGEDEDTDVFPDEAKSSVQQSRD